MEKLGDFDETKREVKDFTAQARSEVYTRSLAESNVLAFRDSGSGQNSQKEDEKSFLEFGQLHEGAGAQTDTSKHSIGARESGALERIKAAFPDESSAHSKKDYPGLTEIQKQMEMVFNEIDTAGTGKISREQLNKAIQDPRFTGASAQALAAIYLLQNALGGKDGITKESLTTLQQMQKAFELSSAVGVVEKISRLLLNSEKIDSQDITKKALAEQIKSGNLSSSEQALLTKAIDRFDDFLILAGSNGDSLSRYDLKKLAEFGDKFKDISISMEINLAFRRTAESQSQHESGLFGKENRVSAEAVQQGTVGDCPLLASLISLAQNRPDVIKNMIKELSNGKYEVTFPGDPKNPIVIDAPTQAELGLFNGATPAGSWPAVIEKAYGEFVRRRNSIPAKETTLGARPCDESAPAASCLDGGEQFEILKLLSTTQPEEKELRHPLSREFGKVLSEAIKQKAIIVAGSKGFYFPDAEIQSRHMYAIVGFDPSGPDGGTITLADPHGKDSRTAGKPVQVSLFDFHKKFSRIAIAKS